MVAEYSWIVPLLTMIMATSMLALLVLTAHWIIKIIKLIYTIRKNKDN